MKNLRIFLIALIFTLSANSVIGQVDNSESKTVFIKSLIKIDTYLTESSNTDYDSTCRIMFHKKAIDAYKEFETTYVKIEPDLNAEIKNELIGVRNVYGQFAEEKNFQYLKDASAKTALAICSVSVEKIANLLIE